ncbi:hypothetical protein MPSEU_000802500 [Mayamaea pseudoterrestris]|nr:hypothetical protein MPSEU_000802500 [Mayamaea pseudoterrestris]
MKLLVSLCSCAVIIARSVQAFQSLHDTRRSAILTRLYGKKTRDESEDLNPLTKASWYAVEAFGNLFGDKSKQQQSPGATQASLVYSMDQPPSSLQETLQRIQADNQRQYFLSGSIDELIYDPDCVFSDPFVSFRGRDRFVQNLANLGSSITEYSARPLQYDESTKENAGNTALATPPVVTTKFMVKLQLNLPWKPVLAWPWGVICEIDPESNLIVSHKETWDIEPLEGVKQIFRKPTTQV